MNTLYPIFLNIERRPVLVVGGGTVAEQKIKGVLEANADVTVIAPQVSAIIENYAGEKKITLHRRKYASGDLQGFFIVIGATNNRDVHQAIFSDAQKENIPVNIVDVPHLCTFFLSSVFQKDDLKIAVSTNGKSPTLGKIIRDIIQAEFSHGYPELLEILGGMRSEVLKLFPDFKSRKKLFKWFVHAELARLPLYSKESVKQYRENSLPKGKVFLIGAGPGDPELMTVKGFRILHSADVVFYDALVNTHLLSQAPEYSEMIYVGKRSGVHCIRQEEINDLLISKAQEGKRVIRLKGGDPLIFGRGGEELEALHKAGIDVEVVPGITAAQAAAASAKISFTQRGVSASVAFCTGAPVESISVPKADTLVYYMGATNLRIIAEKVIASGRKPETSVALIQNVATPNEKIIITSLQDIVLDKTTRYESPLIIIIGDVGKERYQRTFIRETGMVLHKANNASAIA